MTTKKKSALNEIFAQRDYLGKVIEYMTEDEISKIRQLSRKINRLVELVPHRKFHEASMNKLQALGIDPVGILKDLKGIYGLDVSSVRLAKLMGKVPQECRTLAFSSLIFILLNHQPQHFLHWIELHGVADFKEKIGVDVKLEKILLVFAKNLKVQQAFELEAKKSKEGATNYREFYRFIFEMAHQHMLQTERYRAMAINARDNVRVDRGLLNYNSWRKMGVVLGGALGAVLMVSIMVVALPSLIPSLLAFSFIAGFGAGFVIGNAIVWGVDKVIRRHEVNNFKRQINHVVDSFNPEPLKGQLKQLNLFLTKVPMFEEKKISTAPIVKRVKVVPRVSQSQGLFSRQAIVNNEQPSAARSPAKNLVG